MKLSLLIVSTLALVGVEAAKKVNTTITFDKLKAGSAIPSGYGNLNWHGDWTIYNATELLFSTSSPPNVATTYALGNWFNGGCQNGSVATDLTVYSFDIGCAVNYHFRLPISCAIDLIALNPVATAGAKVATLGYTAKSIQGPNDRSPLTTVYPNLAGVGFWFSLHNLTASGANVVIDNLKIGATCS